jgi:hypothetical protein
MHDGTAAFWDAGVDLVKSAVTPLNTTSIGMVRQHQTSAAHLRTIAHAAASPRNHGVSGAKRLGCYSLDEIFVVELFVKRHQGRQRFGRESDRLAVA